MHENILKKCFAEMTGTFALVFCGAGAIVINEISGGAIGHIGIAITFGLIVMGMIYAIGESSGAHINPAVTIGFWVSGRFGSKNVLPYITSQFTGAIMASLLLFFLFPESTTSGETVPSGSSMQAFVMEFVLTFFLMYVIINVSTGSKEMGVMAGIAIGGVVALEAMFAGPVTGASMNPARSLGPAVVSGNFSHLWIYLIAPVAGASIAIIGCRLTKEKGCCGKQKEC